MAEIVLRQGARPKWLTFEKMGALSMVSRGEISRWTRVGEFLGLQRGGC